MDELTRRVDQLETALERERLRVRRLQAGVLALVALVGLVAADAPQRLLRADRIEVGSLTSPAVVIGQGLHGPSVSLRDPAGNHAVLTARGLSFEPADPVQPPTLSDPGTGEADVGSARVVVEGSAHAVEVTCPGTGFRERTAVVGGVAVVRVPTATGCTAWVKGAENPGRFAIEPGSAYRCGPTRCGPAD